MARRGELSYPITQANVKDLNDMLAELYRQRRTGSGPQPPVEVTQITNSGGNTIAPIDGGTGLDTSTSTGIPVLSSGVWSIQNPLGVAKGGTGDSSLTAYAVLCGGTSSTGAVQSVAALGSSGDVLTSNGAAALPTFQAPSTGSGILSKTVTLTAAEINSLSSSPKTLVAAPASGHAVVPIALFGRVHITSVFSAASGFRFRYHGSTTDVFGNWALGLNATGFKTFWVTMGNTGAGTTVTGASDAFDAVAFEVSASADTTGGAVSFATLYLWYYTAAIS